LRGFGDLFGTGVTFPKGCERKPAVAYYDASPVSEPVSASFVAGTVILALIFIIVLIEQPRNRVMSSPYKICLQTGNKQAGFPA
jgi:hypothetical protein